MSIATPTSIDVDGYDLKVIHELYLLMMDDLHQYCVDNGIHYSFFWATLFWKRSDTKGSFHGMMVWV